MRSKDSNDRAHHVVLGAMLVSPITAQAQSDIVGTWKVKESYQLVTSTNEKRYIDNVEVVAVFKYERME
jgi:hypothetical protein